MDIQPTDATAPCHGCGSVNFLTLYSAPSFDVMDPAVFTIGRCTSCGLTRAEPVMTEQELSGYYSTQYYGGGRKKFSHLVEWWTFLDNQWRAHRLLTLLHASIVANGSTGTIAPRILDIGCGRANLLAVLARQGCECHGVERFEFPSDQSPLGVQFHRGALDTLPLKADFFDAVVLWHVLEHTGNPAATLETVAKLLCPGGLLALAVPNFGSWQATFFKSAWFHLDLPRHTHHFDRDTLERLLRRQNLLPFKISTWSIDQNLYGFIQSLLNRIAPKSRANELYTLLKSSKGQAAKLRLLSWLAAASLIVPLAFLEYLLSGFFNRGATLIVYAKKSSHETAH